MEAPINPKQFDEFIAQNHLFEKTLCFMKEYLKNWFEEDREQFFEEFNGDFDHAMRTYTFENGGVSFSKNFSYDDPPLDYLSVWIRITDREGFYLCTYTAFYDYDLNCFDDKIAP